VITYSYQVYHAVLHPHHKLGYFRNAGWEQDWIDTAKDLVHDEFDQSYKEDDNSKVDKAVADSLEKVCNIQIYIFQPMVFT
jgi:hypothetical protein